MTRVDFHSNVPGKLAYACRLVRKAYGAGQKVIVVHDCVLPGGCLAAASCLA